MYTARAGQLSFLAAATTVLLLTLQINLSASQSSSVAIQSYPSYVLQCEHASTSVKLDCAPGYRIEVTSAFFGRERTDWCVQDPFIDALENATYCHTPSLLERLSIFCNEKQNCSTLAADNFAGQPVHCKGGISRYIEIAYQCKRTVYHGLACEASGTLPLVCPDNEVIIPLTAFYGRQAEDEYTCPHANSTTADICSSEYAFTDLQIACDGRRQCELQPTNEYFGDPCPGIYKYLEFEYTCGECRNEYIWDAMCDLWAWTGECELNPFYMIPVCRRSCGMCASEPPLCTDYAGYSDCEYWRGLGMCESNAAWMYPYCYRTCTGCDKGVAEICHNEHFSDVECEERANNNECSTNPGWMYVNCWKACTNCVKECTNEFSSDVSCMMWAANGECEANEAWMWDNCFGYCMGCTDYGCPVDFDIWRDCVEMAENGECETNTTYMYDHCEGACTGCLGQTCTNIANDTDCYLFMLLDQCHENPGWMYQNCWKTCSGCTPDVANYAGDRICMEWANEGECDVNHEWMKVNCWGACNGMTIVNLEDDSQCEMWRRQGECANNYVFMSYYCAGACYQRQLESPLDTCVNVLGNMTQCDEWARNGECYLSPTYMLAYCHASCARCYDNIETENFCGRAPLPGERTDFTQAKTFIVPGEFPVAAKLTHFTGFFVNQDLVSLDIWRLVGNNEFELVYNMEVRANGSNIAQTMMLTECVDLQAGDKLGFTSADNVSPIAQIYNVSPGGSTYFRNAGSTTPFIELNLPYLFSLGAFYGDTTYYCENDD